MINLNLFDFQQEAVDRLLAYTEDITSKQTITVKSPTGSGKTIILIDYGMKRWATTIGNY